MVWCIQSDITTRAAESRLTSLELSAAIQRNDIEVDMVIKVVSEFPSLIFSVILQGGRGVHRLLFPPVADNPLEHSNFSFFHDDGALILLLLFIPWPGGRESESGNKQLTPSKMPLCGWHREEEPIYKLQGLSNG